MNYQSPPTLYNLHQNQIDFADLPANNGYGVLRDDSNEQTHFDLLKIFRIISRHRIVVSALIIGGLICGLIFNLMQTPQYRAQSKIEIVTSSAKAIQDLEVVTQANDIRAFETAKQKMLTRELAAHIVRELNLDANDTFLMPVPFLSFHNITTRFFDTSPAIDITNLSQAERISKAVSVLQSNISASIIRNTSIILLSYSDPDNRLAAKIVNQAMKSFIALNVDRKNETSQIASNFISKQVDSAKNRLQQSEQALVQYARSADITITGDENSLISKSIAEINSALSEAIQQRLSAERYSLQVKAGNAQSLPEVFQSDAVQITKQKIAELRASYQEKLSTLKPDFPEMQRLNAQIQELSRQVNLEISSISKSVDIKFEQAIAKENALRNELAKLDQQQSDFQNKNIQYTILKREADSNRAQYETLITKLNDISVGSKLNISNASIIDDAIPPLTPIYPNLLLNLLASFALFTAIAGIVIYVLEALNNQFSSTEQIEQELKLPTLATIPYIEKPDMQQMLDDIGSTVSEAYRTLRTSLQFTAPDGQMKSLAVTSSGMSDGKTTTSYKLAHDFAALGKKVLLIDADLRKPQLHKLFNLNNDIGLSNLLTNVMCSDDVLKLFRETDDKNITFLSAGTIPPNPVDLLASQKMGLTIHFCSKKYDIVIIDCPPVLGLSDAPIITHQTDATLFVISGETTARKTAASAVTRLRAAGANLVGAVMIKFNSKELAYRYSYGYMPSSYNLYMAEQNEYLLEGHSEMFKWNERGEKLTSPPYEKTIL